MSPICFLSKHCSQRSSHTQGSFKRRQLAEKKQAVQLSAHIINPRRFQSHYRGSGQGGEDITSARKADV